MITIIKLLIVSEFENEKERSYFQLISMIYGEILILYEIQSRRSISFLYHTLFVCLFVCF